MHEAAPYQEAKRVGNGACAEGRHCLRAIGELRHRQVPSSSDKFRNQCDADGHAKQEAQSNRIRGEFIFFITTVRTLREGGCC